MKFHLFGWLNAGLFLFTWYGLFHQFKILRYRRIIGEKRFTKNLSSPQFLTSFTAFFAIFFLGLSSGEFNHYLVWTRLGALLLLIAILFEIHLDRRSIASLISLLSTTLAVTLGVGLMWLRPLPFAIAIGANFLTIFITVILAYGTIHQIRLLDRQKQAPISKRFISSILIKDFSSLAFGLTMPIYVGWPLLLLNGSSFILRGYLLILLLRFS